MQIQGLGGFPMKNSIVTLLSVFLVGLVASSTYAVETEDVVMGSAGAGMTLTSFLPGKTPAKKLSYIDSLKKNNEAVASLKESGTNKGRFSSGAYKNKALDEVFGPSKLHNGPGKYQVLSPLTEEQRAAKIAELDRQISEARRNITIKSGTINGLKQADAKFLELTTARSAILRGETTFYNIQVVDVSKTDNAVERLVKGIRMQSGGLETPIHVSKLGTTAEKTTSKIKLVRYGGLALLGISVIDALSINTDPIESSTQVTGTR